MSQDSFNDARNDARNDKRDDHLNDLWRSDSASASTSPEQKEKEGEEMLTMVIERTRKFDRTILLRNVREIVAALIVTGVFTWLAWRAPNQLERVGLVVVAASGIWITYYLVRFGGGPGRLDPGVNLSGYNRLLLESYEQQIRLLRGVKYWYLLPMYAGMVVTSVGSWLRLHGAGKTPWGPVVSMVIVTAGCGFVWVLNEVYAVRCLEKLKRELKGME